MKLWRDAGDMSRTRYLLRLATAPLRWAAGVVRQAVREERATVSTTSDSDPRDGQDGTAEDRILESAADLTAAEAEKVKADARTLKLEAARAEHTRLRMDDLMLDDDGQIVGVECPGCGSETDLRRAVENGECLYCDERLRLYLDAERPVAIQDVDR